MDSIYQFSKCIEYLTSSLCFRHKVSNSRPSYELLAQLHADILFSWSFLLARFDICLSRGSKIVFCFLELRQLEVLTFEQSFSERRSIERRSERALIWSERERERRSNSR